MRLGLPAAGCDKKEDDDDTDNDSTFSMTEDANKIFTSSDIVTLIANNHRTESDKQGVRRLISQCLAHNQAILDRQNDENGEKCKPGQAVRELSADLARNNKRRREYQDFTDKMFKRSTQKLTLTTGGKNTQAV